MLAAAAAAFAGCGGNKATIKVSSSASGSIPTAKEPVSGLVRRLVAVNSAIQAGNCGPVNAYNKQTGFALLCNAKAKQAYKGFKVLGTATYGTGGVIEFTDAEVEKTTRQVLAPGVKPVNHRKVGIYPIAISPTGRYEVTGPASPILPGSLIGTKPTDWSGADANAVNFLKSVRDNDCSAFFKYALTPRLSKAQACKLGLHQAYGLLHNELTSGKTVS